MRKRLFRWTAAVLCLLTLAGTFCACGTAAPSGMYDPRDAEEYRAGVEEAIFAVPENYTVTMSSNMLAARGEKDSFSLQCRHSDYYYGDLRKNYNELKNELVGLYGAYEESFGGEEITVAGNKALEVRYSLTIAAREYSYVQYLFYLNRSRFFLFTYTAPKGEENEELLQKVLGTVSLQKEGFTVPAGYRAVENARANLLLSDRYMLYCPDQWIFDLSLGQICMRVPSSKILSNISFYEVDAKGDFSKYVKEYSAAAAPGVDVSTLNDLEGYIVSSVYQMMGSFRDMNLTVIASEGEENTKSPTAEELVARRGDYIQVYTSDNELTFSFIDFTVSLPDHNAHGSGGLFVSSENGENDRNKGDKIEEPEFIKYRIRQYFIYHDGYLYFFNYMASESRFDEQYEDAFKVIKNFSFKK